MGVGVGLLCNIIHTALGVEEHESLVEGESVVVGRAGLVVVAGDGLDDEGYEAGEEGGDDEGSDRPEEDLAADDDAAEVHVLLLLLGLAGSQQPALLCLVQLPRQRRPVQVLQIAAPVVVRGGVRCLDLQRPSPRIPSVHTHLSFFNSIANLQPKKKKKKKKKKHQ